MLGCGKARVHTTQYSIQRSVNRVTVRRPLRYGLGKRHAVRGDSPQTSDCDSVWSVTLPRPFAFQRLSMMPQQPRTGAAVLTCTKRRVFPWCNDACEAQTPPPESSLKVHARRRGSPESSLKVHVRRRGSPESSLKGHAKGRGSPESSLKGHARRRGSPESSLKVHARRRGSP